jgi:hypothetical protein
MVRAGDPIRASDVSVQACRVTRTATLSHPGAIGTLTTVPFTSEEFDTDGMHDTITNNTRITIKTAGYYEVGSMGSFEAATTYTRTFCNILLNGAVEIARNQSSGTSVNVSQPMHVNTVYYFDVGDYIEVQVNQASGGAKNLEVTPDRSPVFWAARIGS